MNPPSDPFDGMPARFDYIRDVALRYVRQGRNHDEDDWRRSLDKLSPVQLREIAEVYDRLTVPDEKDALLKWIHEVGPGIRNVWRRWQDQRDEVEDRGLPPPPEPPQEPRAESLFELFDALADLGRAPFTSRRVQYEPAAPDWTRLPDRLQYLVGPATLWGTYQFDEQLDELKLKIRPHELAQLRALARHLRETGDWARALD